MPALASIHPLLFSRIGFVGVQIAIWILLQSGLRLFLAATFGHEAGAVAVADWLRVFASGLNRDLAVASVIFLPFWLLLALIGERWIRRTVLRSALLLVNGVVWALLLFLCIADYYFFEEFRSRFNTVAIDYLLYPHEVFVNVWSCWD